MCFCLCIGDREPHLSWRHASSFGSCERFFIWQWPWRIGQSVCCAIKIPSTWYAKRDTVTQYLVPGTVRPRKNLYDRLSFGFILSLPLLDRSTLFASPSIRQSVSRQPSAYEVSAREHDSLVCAFYCTVFAWSGPIRRATIATRRSRGILWKLSA